MRRAFLLFAFALLACSGVVEATKSDQNAIASSVSLSNGDAKRRSLQADAIDGQASRRLRPVPELTTGGDPGPSTSLMSTIRAKIANWKYKRWFKKGRKPEQVDEDLDLTDEDDKELSEGYHRYYDMRTGQSVSYFGTDGSRSRNSE
ncbi:hypothetical protein PHYBOEH_010092 [Phytophthora boehmeriae]|uniref:RxLR effector protein n=1 Tax=Phytophthora boehmeriae TaxID=109152 RepID=A0A8T1VSH9_9STRA|nr:hypothetical protein PHYBOEH_010092 [Phytophthora boehmeriae]